MMDGQFEDFDATALFCPKCGSAQRVRRHLLLVLPTGHKYEYRCATCGTVLGGKEDNDSTEFNTILTGG